jgi:phage baseplate assembly protein W
MEYLTLPLVLRNGYFPKSDLYDSIADSIGLLLSTRKGSLPFDPEYGCALWEKEYSDLFSANRSEIQASVRQAISQFEQRIFNVTVSLIKVESGTRHSLGVAVRVTGNFRDDSEEKKFEEVFIIG